MASYFQEQYKAYFWINTAFWFTLVETCSLCGVTYVSNRENYRKYISYVPNIFIPILFLAVHEKLFITFMISSLAHMLTCIKGMKALSQTGSNVDFYKALQVKQTLFNVSVLSTIGLVGFFLEHRLLCHRMGKCFYLILY